MESKHVKYIVEITQVTHDTTTDLEKFVTKRTPTKVPDGYCGGTQTYKYAEQYENKSVTRTRENKTQVYRQEVAAMNLLDVISAVNGVAQ